MPKNNRTEIRVSILSHIVPRLAAEAKRKNWDIDLLLEEALIHYLDFEKGKRVYIDDMKKTKPQGKGIVKALGQKGTTRNFKKIETSKGKGAAIASLQNKLAKKRGQPIPFKPTKKK